MEAQRQSALHRCHLEASAHLQSFSGWQLPAWYTEPSTEFEAGVCLRRHFRRQPFKQAGPARFGRGFFPAAARSHLDAHSGAHPDYLTVAHRLRALRVSHGRHLGLQRDPVGRSSIARRPAKAHYAHVRDAAFADGAARQTRLAHVQAMLLRYDCAAPGFLILTTRDVAEYVWQGAVARRGRRGCASLRHAGAAAMDGGRR